MQGLHHLPQNLLPTYLAEVLRVLKPGGLFIVREHDCSDELLPMLDLAHSVFNVLTGVSAKAEEREIRAFRSVDDWLEIIECSGFCNTQIYDVQLDDPTIDVMLCFYKPPWTLERKQQHDGFHSESSPIQSTSEDSASDLSSRATALSALTIAQSGVAWLMKLINDLEASLMSLWPQKQFPAQYAIAHGLVVPASAAARAMMQRLDFLLTAASTTMRESPKTKGSAPASSGTLFPPEMFVAYEALGVRVKSGTASSSEVIAQSILFSIVSAFFGHDSSDSEPPSSEVPCSGAAPLSSSVTASETRQIILMIQSSHPDLMTPVFWQRSGFPKQIQSVVASLGGSVDAASERLAAVLDRNSYDELYAAAQDVSIFHHAPNMEIMLGKQFPGNPWWRCMCAILGSPSIRITQAMRWAAAALGFQEWITLCETSQALRRHSATKSSSETSGRLSTLIEEAKAAFMKCQDITLETTDNKPFPPILNVASLIHARFVQELRVDCKSAAVTLFLGIMGTTSLLTPANTV
jgi:hypothetical protein